VFRFQQSWIAEHRDLYLQATNPDAWKNQSMLAFGSRSADVTALNGRWEMDATPADWLLLDEDGKKRRYTVSVIVDVWSRRLLVVVSRTPKTVTHCLALRAALLAWGVPSEIVTDNGQDYQSEHFKRALLALGITHVSTDPFSPEQKPHVERAIKTLNHSILELLPAFAGHSVADRKAIEARESFARRLAKRGEVVDFADAAALTGEALQTTVNQWLAGIYEQRAHGALAGLSPFAKAASWGGEVRRIADERALDLLLARPAGGGARTLQKKGIAIDGTWFVAPELATIEMGSPLEIYETPDLGRVVVYYRKNFLCIAEAPERTGADRQKIAETATRMQQERMREQKALVRELTKGTAPTDDVLKRHLSESAAAAGKLVNGEFGKTATAHGSHGLTQASQAAAALAGPQPSSRAAELSELAAQAMREAPTNVVELPAARAHATPLEGLTAGEKYALWMTYDALVAAHGGDAEVLAEAWQRRFFVGFPNSSIFRAQATLASAQKETRGG
jgi:putative transposase